jgi:hypothetical protein
MQTVATRPGSASDTTRKKPFTIESLLPNAAARLLKKEVRGQQSKVHFIELRFV